MFGTSRKRVSLRRSSVCAPIALQIVLPDAGGQAAAQERKAAYPAMASLDPYLISDEKSEIALALSAAPSSTSEDAEVMVLKREGYHPSSPVMVANDPRNVSRFCSSWRMSGPMVLRLARRRPDPHPAVFGIYSKDSNLSIRQRRN